MPKSPKHAAVAETSGAPQVGDKVKPGSSEMVYEIDHVSQDGSEVNLYVPGTNLQRFRVRTDTLTFVERKNPAKTSNPFTQPEPTFDAGEVLERIATVQRENLKRLDDDIDIQKVYLKKRAHPRQQSQCSKTFTASSRRAGRPRSNGSRSCWKSSGFASATFELSDKANFRCIC
jgi:hypothetical protein